MTNDPQNSAHQPAAEPAVPAAPSKPKRLATSGTRKGNGAGWGGPAKGAGSGAKRAPAFGAGTKEQS